MTYFRLRNLRRAIVSFLWVVMAYALYSICIVPWIEPRRARDESGTAANSAITERSSDRYVREMQHLFPAGSWELDEPKVLRSEQATVLLKDYQVLKDGSLKIEPCTVIFYGSNRDATVESSRGPIIMQAPEGAILTFADPLDLERPEKISKPVQGSLLGEIRIFSAGRPGYSEDLEFVTSNVEISQRHILTPDQVRFRIGSSYGKGRDLMLTLSESSAAKSNDDQWLGGLDLIELQELDELTLQMAGQDLFESLNQQQAGSSPRRQPTDTSTVKIHCDGPLRFDVRHLIAVVEKNVRMSRQQVGKPKDTLNAERLTMHLARVNKKTEDRGSANPQPSTLDPRPSALDPQPSTFNPQPSNQEESLAVTRIVATGNPLVINAPSENAYVECQRLEYDVQTGQVKLKGWNPFAAPPIEPTGRVIFRNQQHAVVAPSIDYLGGEDRTAWRISAGGPGTYRGLPTNDPQVLVEARWQKSLSLQPERGQQVLRVQGAVDVRANNFGSVEAETVELWLRHDKVASASGSVNRLGVKTRPVPTHLVATAAAGSSVRIETAQFSGSLQQMTAVFTSRPVAASRPGPHDPLTNRQPSRSAVTHDPRRGRSRFRIQGEKLTAWVDLDRQELQRLKMDGPARLTELIADRNGQQPIDIVGNAIDYQIDVQGRRAAQIQGTPAIFQAAGMELQGANIHLSGSENRVWVPGAGSMRLPLPQQLAAQATIKRLTARPAERIKVSWEGGLNFDGQTALFQEGVTATGPDVDFQSDMLRITLDRLIDFSDLSRQEIEPEITEVYADGGVFAVSRSRDTSGIITSIQQMSIPNLQLDYRTGNIVAHGAGWISVTSLDGAMPLSQVRPQNLDDTATTSDDRLMQLSVVFRQQLQGNIWQREVHLYDDIHSWFGPVDSWQQRVDPLQQNALGPDDVRLTCHELFVLESPTAAVVEKTRRPLELLARGDTYVESQTYTARGHQIKYAEEKDMLTLEGDQYRPAELWRRDYQGGPPSSSGRFRMIRYWPRSQKLEVNGGLGVDSDLSGLPAFSR